MTIEGIDVSRWQTTTPSLSGLAFGFAKASEGTTPDPLYAHHLATFKAAADLVTGAYCFSRDDVDIDAQAAYFVKAAGPDPDLLVVDNEGPYAMTVAQTRALIAAVKAHDTLHRPVGLYMSESVFQSGVGADFDWVAHYGVDHPTRHWDFHQYTSTPIDKDRFNGTLAQIKALATTGAPADTGAGGDMYSFTLTPSIGSAKFDGVPNHACVTLDGSPWDSGWKAGTNWTVFKEITLKPPLPGGPAGADRASALLVMPTTKHDGTPWTAAKPACILRMDTDWPAGKTAAPVTDCAPAVKAATDPLNVQLAAAKTTLDTIAKLAAAKAVGGI